MGCNCKSGGVNTTESENINNKQSAVELIVHYSAKISGFLVGVLLSPLIMIAIIWFMFDIIVLNKNVDLSLIMKKVVKIHEAIMADDEETEDDEIEDEFEEYDYVTVNVEEITPKSK